MRFHYVAFRPLNLDGLVVACIHDLQKVPPAIARFGILLIILQMNEQSFRSVINWLLVFQSRGATVGVADGVRARLDVEPSSASSESDILLKTICMNLR